MTILHLNLMVKFMSSNIRLKSTCDFCGNEFIAKTTHTRYCSHTCNRKDYKAQLKKKKINKVVSSRDTTNKLRELEGRDYLSVQDVSVIMGCSSKTIYRLINDGTLKGVNLSQRLTRISRKSLDKLIS